MIHYFDLPSLISQTCIVGDHHDQPQLAQIQPSQVSNFGDSSGPLFSMYSKFAEEEDNKMTDQWTKDADGILIFVSPHTTIHTRL